MGQRSRRSAAPRQTGRKEAGYKGFAGGRKQKNERPETGLRICWLLEIPCGTPFREGAVAIRGVMRGCMHRAWVIANCRGMKNQKMSGKGWIFQKEYTWRAFPGFLGTISRSEELQGSNCLIAECCTGAGEGDGNDWNAEDGKQCLSW